MHIVYRDRHAGILQPQKAVLIPVKLKLVGVTLKVAVVGDVIEEKKLYLEYGEEKVVLFSQDKNPVLKMTE